LLALPRKKAGKLGGYNALNPLFFVSGTERVLRTAANQYFSQGL
jgi:hypothetical protein